MMLIFMFSMVGVPPMVGFYAKLAVLQALINAGYIGVAIVAVVFSVIGAFYYLRVVKLMYFDAPQDTAPLVPASDVKALMTANGMAVLLFGIMPGPLMAICAYAIRASVQF
jgi:NADH-quinone oxidoreductase subunit N